MSLMAASAWMRLISILFRNTISKVCQALTLADIRNLDESHQLHLRTEKFVVLH